MTYLQNIFVPKSKDSQIWGEMAKKNKKWPKMGQKIKKIQKVYQSTTQKLPTPRKSAFYLKNCGHSVEKGLIKRICPFPLVGQFPARRAAMRTQLTNNLLPPPNQAAFQTLSG